MLKKIKVEDLKLGMHLHEMCGSWMPHPSFRSAFKLTDYADIRRIIDSSGLTMISADTLAEAAQKAVAAAKSSKAAA